MAVTTEVLPVTRHNGNGSSDTFAYGFKIFVATDLAVEVDGVLQTYVTDYTLTGIGSAGGGNIVFEAGSIPPSGTNNVVAYSIIPITQTTQYPEASKFPSAQVEQDFDRRTLVEQQLNELQSRSLILPVNEAPTAAKITLPALAARASKFAAWNSAGEIIPAETPLIYAVDPFMETVLDDSSATMARLTLQAQQNIYCPTVGGSANAITLTPVDPWLAYADGRRISFIAAANSTAVVTVNVSGLGATSVVVPYWVAGSAGSVDLTAFSAGQHVELVYRSGSFQLLPYKHPRRLAWTPSVGGNATYTNQAGEYSRDGNVVTFVCNLAINVLGTGSPIQISGFPYNPSQFATFPVYWNGAASSIVTCVGVLGGTTLTLNSILAAGATIDSANNILQNGTVIYVSGSYITADA